MLNNILNKRIRIAALLMFITSVLTLIAAFTGVFYSKIYKDLVSEGLASNFVVAGSINQDLLSILCGLTLFFISIILFKRYSYKLLIVALGLIGYIFYGYTVYTFGGMLTPLYIFYIAIFALSVYCLIVGILCFDSKEIQGKLILGRPIRNLIGIFLIIMSVIMSVKWISDILLDKFKQNQPELYIIAAMDLGIVLPASIVFALMIIKNKAYGIIFSGIVLIKIFTLCLSVAIGTFTAPYFNVKADMEVFYSFLAITIISLILIVLYFKGIVADE